MSVAARTRSARVRQSSSTAVDPESRARGLIARRDYTNRRACDDGTGDASRQAHLTQRPTEITARAWYVPAVFTRLRGARLDWRRQPVQAVGFVCFVIFAATCGSYVHLAWSEPTTW